MAYPNDYNSINRITSLYVITILALSWIAISAIAWGFYYGLKNNHRENVDQTTNKSYIKNKDHEVDELKKDYPVQMNQPVNQIENTNPVHDSSKKNKENERVSSIFSDNPAKNTNPVHDSSKKKKRKDDVFSISSDSPAKKQDKTYISDYKPISPDDVYLLKSAPGNRVDPYPAAQNYQVLSSPEIKPEYQFMQSKKEEQFPVLRPVSAYISQPGTTQYVEKGDSQPCMLPVLPRDNYITTKEQACDFSLDKRKKQDRCCYSPKPKGGSIHPIVQGYRVRGNFRVKRKKNSDIISFMEDSYDVLN